MKTKTLSIILTVLVMTSPSSGRNVRSTSFKVVLLESTPTVLTTVYHVNSDTYCARLCSDHFQSDAPCTGFRSVSGQCDLYTGTILEKSPNEAQARAEMAYKVMSLPKCEEYKDFSFVESISSSGKTLSCFLYQRELKDYESARTDCRARGSYLTFVDDWDKYDNVGLPLGAPFWIGVRRRDGLTLFEGEYLGKTLSPINSLWSVGQPGSGTSEKCVEGTSTGSLRTATCNKLAAYSCEMLEFREKPMYE